MNIREKIEKFLNNNKKIVIVFEFILILICGSFLIKCSIDFVSDNKTSASNIKEVQNIVCEKSEHENTVSEKIDALNNKVEEHEEKYEIEQAEIIEEESVPVQEPYEYVEQPVQNPVQNTENTQSGSVSYGTYKITAYTWTGNTMANGEYPYVGCAASCDFPIGTVIEVVGIGTYVVKDVCPTSGIVDLYMDTYDECMNFGVQYAEIRVVQ